MKDLSIEYAHIYTNDKIDEEHKTSIEILRDTRAKMGSKSYSLVVLVDDYSFPDPTFDYDAFSSWLAKGGFEPNLILRESQLIPLSDKEIEHIKDSSLKKYLVDYVKSKKFPCSLFIAAWYLLRLGYLKMPSFSEELTARELINILPESFKPYEDKALEIMSKTDFVDSEKSVNYKFIKGRTIS